MIRYIGKEQALFIAQKLRDELIFNMAKAEGNPLTFAETSTVIHGLSVAGHKMSDLHQVENIRDGWDFVIDAVRNNRFDIDKGLFIHINAIVARDENPYPGDFRRGMVTISGTKYTPPLALVLNDHFKQMMDNYNTVGDMDSVMDLFLDTARNQYFNDGNKRTGQLVMNGALMMRGHAPFTFAPDADASFREKLLNFYETGEKNDMRQFIYDQINEPRYLLMQEEIVQSDPSDDLVM